VASVRWTAAEKIFAYGHDETFGAKSMKPKRKSPEIVLRDGKPAAVILDIGEYREMLERLEDVEDLKLLQEMRKRPLKFRPLDVFLKGCSPGEGCEG
jgi:hypothetical protein